jgi:hypothetical protein
MLYLNHSGGQLLSAGVVVVEGELRGVSIAQVSITAVGSERLGVILENAGLVGLPWTGRGDRQTS